MGQPAFGIETIEVINQLVNQGVRKLSVLVRHSARHYDQKHMEREPFMWLTEEGKTAAYNFGTQLPLRLKARFFSSVIGRCIETAYSIDKGFINQKGETVSNIIEQEFSPFFVKDPYKVFELTEKLGTETFFRNWFDGKVSTELMDNPRQTAKKMINRLIENQQSQTESGIDIAVSHDWNLYLIKEFYLKLKPDDVTTVNYLEGAVLYFKQDKCYITSHQTEPMLVDAQ